MNISEFGVKELKTHELLIDGGGRIARLAGIINNIPKTPSKETE
ncbi:hypothetical protein [Anaerophaga thermohalophila]|nr:hypothetical protein [Anaerophaga thermohalophila]